MGAIAKALQRLDYFKDVGQLLREYGQQKEYSRVAQDINLLDSIINEYVRSYGNISEEPVPPTQPTPTTPTPRQNLTADYRPTVNTALSQYLQRPDDVSQTAPLSKFTEQPRLKKQTTQQTTPTAIPEQPDKLGNLQNIIAKEQEKRKKFDETQKQTISQIMQSYNTLTQKILNSNLDPDKKEQLLQITEKKLNTALSLLKTFEPEKKDVKVTDIDGRHKLVQYGDYVQTVKLDESYRFAGINSIVKNGKIIDVAVFYDSDGNPDSPDYIKQIPLGLSEKNITARGGGSSADKEIEDETKARIKADAYVTAIKNNVSDVRMINGIPTANLKGITTQSEYLANELIDKKIIDYKDLEEYDSYMNRIKIAEYVDNKGNKYSFTYGDVPLQLNYTKVDDSNVTKGLTSDAFRRDLIIEMYHQSKKQKNVDVYNFYKKNVDDIANKLKRKYGYNMSKADKSYLTNFYFVDYITNLYYYHNNVIKNIK